MKPFGDEMSVPLQAEAICRVRLEFSQCRGRLFSAIGEADDIFLRFDMNRIENIVTPIRIFGGIFYTIRLGFGYVCSRRHVFE
jgi:hypothetical protein